MKIELLNGYYNSTLELSEINVFTCSKNLVLAGGTALSNKTMLFSVQYVKKF